jgi:hypothetical protein
VRSQAIRRERFVLGDIRPPQPPSAVRTLAVNQEATLAWYPTSARIWQMWVYAKASFVSFVQPLCPLWFGFSLSLQFRSFALPQFRNVFAIAQ